MIGRRGFLTLLGLGGVGLMLDPILPEVLPGMVETPLVLPVGSKLITPLWVTKEVAEQFNRSLKAHGWLTKYAPSRDGLKVGNSVDGVEMTSQVNVTMPPWAYGEVAQPSNEEEALELLRERYFRPAGETLAASVRHHRLTHLSDLPMPSGGAYGSRVSSEHEGFSLRGVRAYDIHTDTMRDRFDVIGGEA